MRLSLKAMAIAGGLLGGGGVLFVGLMNLIFPNYGSDFIQLASSVYPWFRETRSIGNVAIGTIDGLVDGGLAGLLLAWLYNAFGGVETKELRRIEGPAA
jgi:hypothetical protein